MWRNGTSSAKAHGDRAGCASAMVETRGDERSAAPLWTADHRWHIRTGLVCVEPHVLLSPGAAVPHRDRVGVKVGGRLSRNRHPVRTVSSKGCECLSGIEINRERSRLALIYFHHGTAFVPVGLAGTVTRCGQSASKDASAYPVLKSTGSEADLP